MIPTNVFTRALANHAWTSRRTVDSIRDRSIDANRSSKSATAPRTIDSSSGACRSIDQRLSRLGAVHTHLTPTTSMPCRWPVRVGRQFTLTRLGDGKSVPVRLPEPLPVALPLRRHTPTPTHDPLLTDFLTAALSASFRRSSEAVVATSRPRGLALPIVDRLTRREAAGPSSIAATEAKGRQNATRQRRSRVRRGITRLSLNR